MTAADLRRIALSPGGSGRVLHNMGLPVYRVGGWKFVSSASQAGGHGNLMLTLEQQPAFVEEALFLLIPGGCLGNTHIRLAPSEGQTPHGVETAS